MNKRMLKRDEIGLVDESIRALVLKAWSDGHEVPFSVSQVFNRPLSDEEIKRGRLLSELAKRLASSD